MEVLGGMETNDLEIDETQCGRRGAIPVYCLTNSEDLMNFELYIWNFNLRFLSKITVSFALSGCYLYLYTLNIYFLALK